MGYYQINTSKNNKLKFGASWPVMFSASRESRNPGKGGFVGQAGEETPAAR